jgi:predicted GNAT family N-acyltransferase
MSDPQAAVTLEVVHWPHDRARIERVRRAVFIEEQRIPEADEWDDSDPLCWHVLALAANRDVVGTGRLDPDGKIGRVAVLPQYRGTGIGAAIVSRLVDLAAAQGLTQVHLNAQVSALRFYERLGFRAEGPEFDEVGIPHRRMRQRIGNENEQRAGRSGNTERPVEPR